jgi:hypothetical protein
VDATAGFAPSRPLRRAAPLVCGCAAAIGLAVVAANDPASPGSRFPPCAFRQMTGLWCPGCGLTRGLHQLLRGDVLAALGQNVFTPFAIVAGMWLWITWVRVAWDRPALTLPASVTRPLVWVAPPLVVLYGVLRNVPVAPFRSLAP